MQLDQLNLYDLGQFSLALSDILTKEQQARLWERIPEVMRSAGAEEVRCPVPQLTPAQYAEIAPLIDTKRIWAIKLIRQYTRMGLWEAKDIADNWPT